MWVNQELPLRYNRPPAQVASGTAIGIDQAGSNTAGTARHVILSGW
jgi:hypothetical protein